MRGRNKRRESSRRQFALRSFGVRKTRRRVRRKIRERKSARFDRERKNRCSRARGAGSVRVRRTRERKPVCYSKRSPGNNAGFGGDRAQRNRNARSVGGDRQFQNARRKNRGHGQSRVQ